MDLLGPCDPFLLGGDPFQPAGFADVHCCTKVISTSVVGQHQNIGIESPPTIVGRRRVGRVVFNDFNLLFGNSERYYVGNATLPPLTISRFPK